MTRMSYSTVVKLSMLMIISLCFNAYSNSFSASRNGYIAREVTEVKMSRYSLKTVYRLSKLVSFLVPFSNYPILYLIPWKDIFNFFLMLYDDLSHLITILLPALILLLSIPKRKLDKSVESIISLIDN